MAVEFSFLRFLQTLHTPLMDAAAVFLNYAGAHGELWIVFTAVLLLFRRTRKTGVMMALGLILYFILCDRGIKPLVARPRPCDLDASVSILVPRPGGWSFPSGHTASAFSAATPLLYTKNKLAPYAIALCVFIAFTRLYLYVHFPTDVLAGAVFGSLIGYAAFRIANALDARRPLKTK